jgi:hypothetical protein
MTDTAPTGAKLPATVTVVERLSAGTYGVTVAFWDGTTASFLIPDNLATAEAVSISAVAMAVLSDNVAPGPKQGSRKGWRWQTRFS